MEVLALRLQGLTDIYSVPGQRNFSNMKYFEAAGRPDDAVQPSLRRVIARRIKDEKDYSFTAPPTKKVVPPKVVADPLGDGGGKGDDGKGKRGARGRAGKAGGGVAPPADQ